MFAPVYRSRSRLWDETNNFFSDNCGGKNRNRFVVAMYWNAVRKNNIQTITHKFLERGHTQNENDSVHSTVESAAKNVTIYTPEQWYSTVRMARRRQPYDVKQMKGSDCFDFKDLSKCLTNFNTDYDGEKVKWMEARLFQIRADDPNALYLKYAFDSGFVHVDLLRHSRRSTPNPDLVHLYTGPLSISAAKYKDLQILCTSGLIPSTCHHFYKSLKHEWTQAWQCHSNQSQCECVTCHQDC